MTGEWASPTKMLDYYVDQSNGIEAARTQLYLAVIAGDIRAKTTKGSVLGPEWRKQLSLMKFDDEDPFALPPNLLLSVDDAKRLWRRWSHGPDREPRARDVQPGPEAPPEGCPLAPRLGS
jgi:hypothetical protein